MVDEGKPGVDSRDEGKHAGKTEVPIHFYLVRTRLRLAGFARMNALFGRSDVQEIRCGILFHDLCLSVGYTVKVKSAVSHEECRRGAHLPPLDREPVAG